MEKTELEKKFEERYAEIIASQDLGQMERLGEMVKRVMHWMFKYEPGVAQQAMKLLDEDGDCRNQLTEKEAINIVAQMDPKPVWHMSQLAQTLEQMKLRLDEQPYFNRWALLTTMLMIQSDEGDALSAAMNTSKGSERMVTVIYQLALCRLKDIDGKFNIRKYFDLDENQE